MMGIKPRTFHSIEAVTLEQLASADHFYRQLERTLDLLFVRALVADCYAAGGRPSIDPVVFFALQLVMFFDGGVAIRDNLTTVYAAVSDDLPHVRTMERISTMGGELVT